MTCLPTSRRAVLRLRFGRRRRPLEVSLARFSSVAAVCGALLAGAAPAKAASVYWDNDGLTTGNSVLNGTNLGGTGTWDLSTANWFDGTTDRAWNNSNLDTAVFWGTTGTVTLGAPIIAGGLTFNTTGFTIAPTATNTLSLNAVNNFITLNNVVTATINGPLIGTGAVTVTGGMFGGTVAGSLTLNGTIGSAGWSGATTVSNNMTLALGGTNTSLSSTTGSITLNNGGISLTNLNATEGAQDRVNNATPIVSSSGTFTYTNTVATNAVYAETIGSLSLNSGQTNIVLTTNQNGTSNSQTLTLGGLTGGGTGAASVTFSAASTSPNATTNKIVVTGAGTTATGIIGPWATLGTGTGTQTDYAIFSANNVVPANVAATTEGNWTNAALSYTSSVAAVTLGGTRTITALRNTSATGTLTLATGANLNTYGVLNGASTLFTIAATGTGTLSTPTGGGNLYVTPGSAAMTISAPINDNAGAVTLVKNGNGILTLSSATSNFSGGLIINSGQATVGAVSTSVSIASDANLGATTGGLTFNSNGSLLITATGITLDAGRTVTLNNGSLAKFEVNGAFTETIAGKITGTGGVILSGSSGNPAWNLTSTASDFQGPLVIGFTSNTFTAGIASLVDSASANGAIRLGGTTGTNTFQWSAGALAPLVLNNRQIDLRGTTGGGALENANASAANSLTVNTDLFVSGTGAKTFTLTGTNTGNNAFNGRIADGVGSAIAVTKAGTGTWTLGGSNAYTGATAITGGTLKLGSATAIPSASALTIASGAGVSTLDLNGNSPTINAITFGGAAGTATSQGNILLNGGTLSLNSVTTVSTGNPLGATISGSGAVDFGGATRTLTVAASTGSNAADLTIGSVIQNGGLTKAGAGVLVLSGANTYAGGTTVSAGVLDLRNTAAKPSGDTATVAASATLALGVGGAGFYSTADVDNLFANTFTGVTMNATSNVGIDTTAGNFTYASSPTGTRGLAKYGANTLLLTGASTYTGGTTIAAGTLQLGSTTALPAAGNLSLSGNGVLDLNGFNTSVVSIAASAATNLITDTSAGAGTTRLAITNNAGTIAVPITDGPSKKIAVDFTNANTNSFNFATPSTFSGGLNLLNNATGTRFNITTAIANVGTAGAIVSSPFGTGPIALGQAATDKAQILLSTVANTILNDIVVNTANGTDTLGTFRIDTTGITLAGAIQANLSSVAFRSNGTGAVTLTGPISTGANAASGLSLLASTTGLTVTLNNPNTTPNSYTGDTLLSTSTKLVLGGNDQIPNGAGKGLVNLSATTATLDLNGKSDTINGLTGTGTVDNATGSGLLTVGDGDASSTFSGVLKNTAGTLSLVKTGTGTLTLNGTGTYTGSTTVNGGTLSTLPAIIATTSALNIGTTGNATLDLSTDGVAAPLNLVAGTNLSIGGATTAGSLLLNVGATADTINLTGASQLTVGAGGGIINLAGVAGLVSGPYTLLTTGPNNIIGAGTLTLGKTTGMSHSPLTVDPVAGTVTVNLTAAVGDYYWKGGTDASWLTQNASGAGLNFVDSTNAAVTATPGVASDVYFSAPGAARFTQTLDAPFSVKGLKFTSTGSAVTINPGTGGSLTLGTSGIDLQAGAPASANITAPVALGADQTWNVADAASTLTVDGALTGAFNLTTTGSGTIALTNGASTFGGAGKTLAIQNGTLRFAAPGALGSSAGSIALGTATGLVTLQYTGATGTLGQGIVLGGVAASATGHSLIVPSGSVLTLSGIVSGGPGNATGNTALTVSGGGTAVFSGANTFTGDIIADGAAVQFNALSGFGTSSSGSTNKTTFLKNGGTLIANATMDPTAAGADDKRVSIGAGGGTIQVNSGFTYTLNDAGQFGGTGDLTKTGAGALTIGNATAYVYTGANVNVLAGTLTINTAGGLGTAGTINIGDTTGSNAATLALLAGTIPSSTALVVRGGSSGVKTIRSTNASGTTTFASQILLNDNVTLDTTSGGTLALTGGLNDGGVARIITKAGGGTLTIAGPHTNLLSTSTLNIGSTGSVALGAGTFAPAINVTGTGLASVGIVQATGGVVTLTNSLTFNANTSAGGNVGAGSGASLFINGPLILNAPLTGFTQRVGTVTYNTKVSGTAVNPTFNLTSGTANWGLSDIFPAGSALGIQANGAAATLNLNGFNQTTSGITFGTAAQNFVGTINTGTGTLTLAGPVTNVLTVVATHVINGKLSLNGASQTFNILDGTGNATADVSIPAVISNGGINKTGPGTLALSAVNTYTGKTVITAGTINISSEANLGADPGTPVADQLTLNGGTLAATASFSIDDPNRGLQVGNGTTGTGTIDVAAAQTLTVLNAISGAGGSLAKTGAGILVLGGTNTFNGGTTVSAGRLVLTGASAAGAGPITLNGGLLDAISTALPITVGAAATGSSLVYNAGITTDLSSGLIMTAGGTLNVAVLSGAGPVTFASPFGSSTTAGLAKTGPGTLILAPAAAPETYTGKTTVASGTLQLNFGAASLPPSTDIINAASVLEFQGGTLNLNGASGATNSQTFASTSLTAGASALTLTSPGTSLTANLGAITARTAGSSLHFAIPSTTTTFANVSTTSNNSAGILGGWATFGTAAGVATDWATKDGSNNVVALPSGSYTTLAVAGGTANHFTMGASVTLSGASISADTLRLTAASTLALGTFNAGLSTATGGLSSNIGAGGILYSAATGTGVISGTTNTTGTGFISVPAATSDLPIYVSTGGSLTISAGVGGTVTGFGLTKSGGGTLTLSNTGTVKNNFTGGIVINGGLVAIGVTDQIGSTSGALTLNGGTFQYASSSTTAATFANPLVIGLNGGALNNNATATNTTFSGAISYLGSGPRNLTLAGTTGSRFGILTGVLADSGGPTSLVVSTGDDTSIWQLNGANTYTGSTTITRGSLNMSAAASLSSSTNVIFNGGTGTNRALLEFAGNQSFTNALGTAPGQVQWLGNGGFAAQTSGATLTVNLGGQATPAMVTWGSGGFVPTGSTLQFGQNAGTNGSMGVVDFRNPINLNGAARTVDVIETGGTNPNNPAAFDVIFSGALSGQAGSELVKAGLGTLQLSGVNNTSGVKLTINANGGTVALPSAASLPNGAISLAAGSSLLFIGNTNPLAALTGSTITSALGGNVALDVDSSAALDFTTLPVNLALGAFSNSGGSPVEYTGVITPNAGTYRFASAALNSSAAAGSGTVGRYNILQLPRAYSLTGTNGLNVGTGDLYLTTPNDYTGPTTVSGLGGVAVVGVGNDSALGTNLVTFTSTAGNVAYAGSVNGDHTLSNNIKVAIASGAAWIAAGNGASDGIANGGAMTYLGSVDLNAIGISIFARVGQNALFLGDIKNAGTITITPSNGNASNVSFLTLGGPAKSYNAATSLGDSSTLTIDSNGSLGDPSKALTIGGSTAGTAATLRIQPGAGNVSLATGASNRNITLTSDRGYSFQVGAGDSLTIAGVISGATGTLTGSRTIQKNDAGTLVLQGKNTFGVTNSTFFNQLLINAGRLVLDSANLTAGTDRIIPESGTTAYVPLFLGSASATTFSNGAIVELKGKSGYAMTQNFGNITVNPKQNQIIISNVGIGVTLGLAAATGNTINRIAGGTLDLTVPAGGVINSVVTNTNNILGGYATFNKTDWVNASGTNLTAFTGYTTLVGPGSSILDGATSHVRIDNTSMDNVGASLPATNISTLQFSDTADRTIDLSGNTLRLGAQGGLLAIPGSGALTIQNGSLSAGGSTANTAGELILHAWSGNNLRISATIVDNGSGAVSLVKSGSGTVTLSGVNSFTGPIFLHDGVLNVNAAPALGNATVGATNLTMDGGALQYSGNSTLSTNRGITVSGPSIADVVDAAGLLEFTSGVNGINSAALNGISGAPGILTKQGAGTLSLSGTVDNPNLSVAVTNGTLLLNKTGAATSHSLGGAGQAALLVSSGGTARITGTNGDQIADGSSIVINGTSVFDINGFNETIDGLAGTGLVTNLGANATPVTLSIGGNNGANISAYTPAAAAAGVASTGLNSFSGTISDNASGKLALNKVGAGSQTLSYTGPTSTYTYTGDTTITAGTLFLRSANLLPSGSGFGNVNLVGNTVLSGITVPGVLDTGALDQSINGLNGTAGSIVTSTPANTVSADQTSTLTVGGNAQSSTFAGLFQDGYVVKPGTTPVAYRGILAVTKTGTGTLTLTGASTNTGTVTVNGGRIDLGSSNGNALATNITVNTNGTLKLLASNQIADAKAVTVAGGSFDLNGFNETAGVVLTGGSIVDSAGNGSLSSGSAFDLEAGTVAAALAGSSGLNKTTAGIVTLTKANSFSGATGISAGTLVIGNTGSLTASSGVTLSNTGTKFYVDGTTGAAVPIAIAADTTLGGTGTVAGTATVAAGGLIEAGHGGLGSLTIQNLLFNAAGTVSLFNIDGGASASLLKVPGLLTTGAGPITITSTNSGSLANGTYDLIGFGTIGGAGNGAFLIGNIGQSGRQNAALAFGTVHAGFISVTVSGDAPRWNGYDGSVADSVWHPSFSGNLNWKLISGGTATDFQANDQALFNDLVDLAHNANANQVDIAVADVNPQSVTFNNSAVNYTLLSSGNFGIVGAGTSLTKTGSGTLTVSNANTFTGGVNLDGGVLRLNNSVALAAGNSLNFDTAAPAGTKLQLNGFNVAFSALDTASTTAAIENGAAANSVLTVNRATGTSTFAGILRDGATGTLGLTKDGAGTLVLTGTNTATGLATVANGTLQIGSGSTSGTLAANASIASGATLAFNRSNTSTYAGSVTGAGTLSVLGGGTLVLTGAVAHDGATNVASGSTLQIGNGGASGALSGLATITNNGAISFNRTGSSAIAGTILGTGTVTVAAGTLVYTGANSYTGATTVNSGATLQVGNNGTSGTFGTGSLTNNGTVAVNRADSLTVSTAMSGTGSLHIINGSAILTGANTYSGGTLIDDGAALVVGTGAVGSINGLNNANPGGITVNGAGLVEFNRSGTNTFANAIDGSGGVKIDQGNFTFLTGNTYTGTTTIAPGATLQIGNGAFTPVIGPITNSGTILVNRTTNYTLPATNLISGTGNVVMAGTGKLVSTVDNQLSVGGVTFGATAGAAVVTGLDFNNASGNLGNILAQTNGATPNTIEIGAGKSVTATGLSIGYQAPTTTTVTTTVAISGAGTFTVSGGNFQVGVPAGTVDNRDTGTLDLSNLTGPGGGTPAFTANVGVFSAGQGQSSSGVVTLSNGGNAITATSLIVGDSAGQNGGAVTSSLTLGIGSNVIKADTINIAFSKVAATLGFASQTTPGTVTITSKTGGGANITVSSNNNTSTGSITNGTLELRGHVANVTAGALVVGNANNVNTGGSTGAVNFDTGTFTANTVSLGLKSGTAGTGTGTGNLNISGGSFTVNPGGSFVLAMNTAATGAAVGTVNLTGGTLTSNADITRGTGANTTANFNLNGANAVLDLTAHKLGTAALPINFTVTAGTLQNLSELNGGGALTKTGTGTLILDGGNGYTGVTNITAGIANLRSSTGLGSATGGTVVSANAALELQNDLFIDGEALSLIGTGVGGNGALRNVSGMNFFGGQVTLAGAAKIQSDAGLLYFYNPQAITGTGTNLTFDGAGDILMEGAIAITSGSLTKSGAGTVMLTGPNAYTGGTTITAGKLQVGNGGTSGTLPGDVTNNATLAFNRTDDVTYAGTFTGTGKLVQQGTGKLILTGTGSTAGLVEVQAGTVELHVAIAADTHVSTGAHFDVTNLIGSTYNVSTGGFLYNDGSVDGSVTADGTVQGNGLVTGNLTANLGGTIAPGNNGLGTLTALGALTFSGGSKLNIDLAGTPLALSDLVVGSSISLTGTGGGVTLNLGLLPGAAIQGNGAVFFIASNTGTGAVAGTFANATSQMSVPGFGSEVFTVLNNPVGGDGAQFAISYDANLALGTFHGGNDIALMAVPEPSSTTALALGLSTLAALQRFRRRRS